MAVKEVSRKADAAGSSINEVAKSSTGPDEKLVPAAPERSRTAPKKRKRLAKAFKRPLDKKLKKERMVSDSYVMSQDDYAQLIELKHRLMILGLDVKKNELLRAGLLLLTALDDADLTVVVDKIRCAGI